MILPLQLRHGAALDFKPAGWFLPGDSVVRWVEELTRCGLACASTRLFVVPKSVQDRAPAGLLVLSARADSVAHQPVGLACRLVAGRLLVPVNAILHPPVTDAELTALCPLPISFFHPVLGLSGFETEATWRVWDLIELPEERPEHWNLARIGASAFPELRTVSLRTPPSLQDIFGGAQEEIGSQPPLNLPPAPNEPSEDALEKSKQHLQRWFAKGMAAAARHIPHTGQRRTWVNDAEEWAQRQLRSGDEQLETIRHKELHRLLHLFDKDPEAALRHAIPLSGLAHRGVAPPGGRLGPHGIDFDPGRLGGRAADFWNVPANLQEALRLRYRETADREMQLGRYRRAAYIYAELLGDLVSAANALKQGKHFREAALLYEEHLQNPIEAAKCLADGGLIAEAIERYEKLGRWLDVADLYDRLGQSGAAESAVRRVVHERLTVDDILGAAKLVEGRLHGADEALEMLLRAWPASRQAAACVGAAFQLLARLGRHEPALELMARLSREAMTRSALPLLTALAGPARDYPHALVRHRASDVCRVLIARQLSNPLLTTHEAGPLLECLVRLTPQDRLLARDANRHLSGRREALMRSGRVAPPAMPNQKLVVARRFELPRQIRWLQMRGEGHWFFAVGVTPNHLTLVRGVWEGELQSVSWECSAEAVQNNGLLFEPTVERGKAVVLKSLNGPEFPVKRLPAADIFFGVECNVGEPAWLNPQHWPVAFGEDSIWTAHVAGGRGIISCHDKRGTLQRTIDVTAELLSGAERGPQTRLCLSVIRDQVAIALGTRLVITRSDGELTCLVLPGQVVRLVATLPHTREGLAIMLEDGAVMHWVGAPGLFELHRGLVSPTGTFVPAGPLVLISDSLLLLLDVGLQGVRTVTRVELAGPRPVGVIPAASPGQFAVLSAKGEMTIYAPTKVGN